MADIPAANCNILVVFELARFGVGRVFFCIRVGSYGSLARGDARAVVSLESIRRPEHIRNFLDPRGVPTLEALIENSRTSKHEGHVGDLGCVPVAELLIKRTSLVEHRAHGGDLGCVPTIEFLIKIPSPMQHFAHDGSLCGVPAVDGVG